MPENLCWIKQDDTFTWKVGEPSLAPFEVQMPAVSMVTDVLLVEDDTQVREALGEALGSAGWRVSEAADAMEALDRMTFDGMPGVLVADLGLGQGMSGLALIAAVRLRWPHLPAVLISGTDIEEPALGPADRFLRKPFNADTLTRAVLDVAAGQGMAGLDRAAA